MKNFINPSATIKPQVSFEPPVHIADNVSIWNGARLGRYTYVNSYSTIGGGTRIGRFCAIARHVEIGAVGHPTDFLSVHPFQYSNRHFGKSPGYRDVDRVEFDEKPPTRVGHDVWIGAKALILRGLSIGNGAIIAAGAVVTRDVEPYTIVGGLPAREIRKRFAPEIVDRLQSVCWWDRDLSDLSGLPFDDVEAALTRLEAMADPG